MGADNQVLSALKHKAAINLLLESKYSLAFK